MLCHTKLSKLNDLFVTKLHPNLKVCIIYGFQFKKVLLRLFVRVISTFVLHLKSPLISAHPSHCGSGRQWWGYVCVVDEKYADIQIRGSDRIMYRVLLSEPHIIWREWHLIGVTGVGGMGRTL